jgi:hypothetical protein
MPKAIYINPTYHWVKLENQDGSTITYQSPDMAFDHVSDNTIWFKSQTLGIEKFLFNISVAIV